MPRNPPRAQSTSTVWADPKRVQAAYGQSIQYSLGAMFSFLQNYDDPNLVVIALGDHQPATIVSGEGASHEVPISIISKDPAVFARDLGVALAERDAPDLGGAAVEDERVPRPLPRGVQLGPVTRPDSPGI